MEQSSGSLQVPLLGNQPNPRPSRSYFNTNIIDDFLFFWVGKFIDVLSFIFLSHNISSWGIKRPFNKICIGV